MPITVRIDNFTVIEDLDTETAINIISAYPTVKRSSNDLL